MAAAILGHGKGRRPQIKDRTGQQYGWLTAVEHVASRISNGNAIWRCRCQCGKLHDVEGRLLGGKSGVKSCGCLLAYKNTLRPVRSSTNLVHGHASKKLGDRSPEYQTWISMRQRCGDPQHSNYAGYGARGIKMCVQWEDFEVFLRDMGPRPAGTSIDRKDVNGDYSPDNCRWASDVEQANNRRSNRFVTAGGEIMTTAEACRRFGIPGSTASHWYRRVGECGSIDGLLARRAISAKRR